ncbi:hypothetical protein ALC56_14948 [Trachymyrmex septentrionalis]|uniref:Uncharacterized protein n=1 Tax=Trachymyrmex septentrionalis TaxID=34720 RepID=A0A151JTG6_9HYME|nr:hypothetical protein ALC56_14948 [Trachymyrmex septentrionalis]
MRLMSIYLNESKIKVNPISFTNIFMSFISAYGAKAILVTRKQDENYPKEALSVSTQAEPAQSCSTKKRKSNTVAIIMQQATFQGMERVIKCVDTHVNQLTFIDYRQFNECVQYLIKKIKLLLTNSYIDSEIIKLSLFETTKKTLNAENTNKKFVIFENFNIFFKNN